MFKDSTTYSDSGQATINNINYTEESSAGNVVKSSLPTLPNIRKKKRLAKVERNGEKNCTSTDDRSSVFRTSVFAQKEVDLGFLERKREVLRKKQELLNKSLIAHKLKQTLQNNTRGNEYLLQAQHINNQNTDQKHQQHYQTTYGTQQNTDQVTSHNNEQNKEQTRLYETRTFINLNVTNRTAPPGLLEDDRNKNEDQNYISSVENQNSNKTTNKTTKNYNHLPSKTSDQSKDEKKKDDIIRNRIRELIQNILCCKTIHSFAFYVTILILASLFAYAVFQVCMHFKKDKLRLHQHQKPLHKHLKNKTHLISQSQLVPGFSRNKIASLNYKGTYSADQTLDQHNINTSLSLFQNGFKSSRVETPMSLPHSNQLVLWHINNPNFKRQNIPTMSTTTRKGISTTVTPLTSTTTTTTKTTTTTTVTVPSTTTIPTTTTLNPILLKANTVLSSGNIGDLEPSYNPNVNIDLGDTQPQKIDDFKVDPLMYNDNPNSIKNNPIYQLLPEINPTTDQKTIPTNPTPSENNPISEINPMSWNVPYNTRDSIYDERRNNLPYLPPADIQQQPYLPNEFYKYNSMGENNKYQTHEYQTDSDDHKNDMENKEHGNPIVHENMNEIKHIHADIKDLEHIDDKINQIKNEERDENDGDSQVERGENVDSDDDEEILKTHHTKKKKKTKSKKHSSKKNKHNTTPNLPTFTTTPATTTTKRPTTTTTTTTTPFTTTTTTTATPRIDPENIEQFTQPNILSQDPLERMEHTLHHHSYIDKEVHDDDIENDDDDDDVDEDNNDQQSDQPEEYQHFHKPTNDDGDEEYMEEESEEPEPFHSKMKKDGFKNNVEDVSDALYTHRKLQKHRDLKLVHHFGKGYNNLNSRYLKIKKGRPIFQESLKENEKKRLKLSGLENMIKVLHKGDTEESDTNDDENTNSSPLKQLKERFYPYKETGDVNDDVMTATEKILSEASKENGENVENYNKYDTEQETFKPTPGKTTTQLHPTKSPALSKQEKLINEFEAFEKAREKIQEEKRKASQTINKATSSRYTNTDNPTDNEKIEKQKDSKHKTYLQKVKELKHSKKVDNKPSTHRNKPMKAHKRKSVPKHKPVKLKSEIKTYTLRSCVQIKQFNPGSLVDIVKGPTKKNGKILYTVRACTIRPGEKAFRMRCNDINYKISTGKLSVKQEKRNGKMIVSIYGCREKKPREEKSSKRESIAQKDDSDEESDSGSGSGSGSGSDERQNAKHDDNDDDSIWSVDAEEQHHEESTKKKSKVKQKKKKIPKVKEPKQSKQIGDLMGMMKDMKKEITKEQKYAITQKNLAEQVQQIINKKKDKTTQVGHHTANKDYYRSENESENENDDDDDDNDDDDDSKYTRKPLRSYYYNKVPSAERHTHRHNHLPKESHTSEKKRSYHGNGDRHHVHRSANNNDRAHQYKRHPTRNYETDHDDEEDDDGIETNTKRSTIPSQHKAEKNDNNDDNDDVDSNEVESGLNDNVDSESDGESDDDEYGDEVDDDNKDKKKERLFIPYNSHIRKHQNTPYWQDENGNVELLNHIDKSYVKPELHHNRRFHQRSYNEPRNANFIETQDVTMENQDQNMIDNQYQNMMENQILNPSDDLTNVDMRRNSEYMANSDQRYPDSAIGTGESIYGTDNAKFVDPEKSDDNIPKVQTEVSINSEKPVTEEKNDVATIIKELLPAVVESVAKEQDLMRKNNPSSAVVKRNSIPTPLPIPATTTHLPTTARHTTFHHTTKRKPTHPKTTSKPHTHAKTTQRPHTVAKEQHHSTSTSLDMNTILNKLKALGITANNNQKREKRTPPKIVPTTHQQRKVIPEVPTVHPHVIVIQPPTTPRPRPTPPIPHVVSLHDPRQIRILCFGDSLTAGYNHHGKNFFPYGRQLQNILNFRSNIPVFVDIRGIVGEMTHKQMTHRMPLVLGNATYRYDWVIILGGTNDILHVKNFADDQEFLNQLETVWQPRILKDIEKLHEIAYRYGSHTMMLTVPENTIELWSDYKPLLKMRERINESLRDYAYNSRGETVLCDIAKKIPRHSLSTIDEARFWDDHLHMTPLGYTKMAGAISDCLRPYLPHYP